MEKIVVVGLGRLGLPFAATLAKNRNLEVVGVDLRADLVEALAAGATHSEEPGVDLSLVREFTTNLQAALQKATAAAIVVNTPPTPDGHLDHGAVERCLAAIVDGRFAMAPGGFVVLVSTVEPKPLRALAANAKDHGIALV